MRQAPIVALALLFAACKAPPASGPAAATPAPEPEPAAAPGGSLRVDLPAAGTIGFEGFGPAEFGASAEEVRMAWGGDLGDAAPSEPGGCHYLIPATQAKQGYKIAFMIEGGKFVRIDVASGQIAAPGGGRIGMSAAELQRLYGNALSPMPHKYVEGGHYLSVAGDAAPGRLVFETDANGKVTEWRVGVPPQVDYIEGCS
ncbi:lectin [Pseudoxanthomonas sangjuensis]|uniref:hypothetical protein n=1 Tax=Pseudoxanthomonas sangjuensis TaxID=1503750 RepID=UPI001390A32D|nr:hypothetical protein [Pseudoxanthomonas sangjuensis]KAF1713915.1 hypothetical protein CSC71_05945 [Pseudoxanthomonas sangjuensis]